MTNAEKGRHLEQAVRRIETSIIECSPGFSESTFEIQPNKIISLKGVRYEIDIWVKATRPDGSLAIFIFECKNRKEKVDKNDISIFDEKFGLTNAEKGFFVGRSFTKDALARIEWNPRLRPLIAEELDPSALSLSGWGIPFRCNFEDEEVYVAILLKSKQPPRDGYLGSHLLEIKGEKMPVGKFVAERHLKCRDMFPAHRLPSGLYPYQKEVKTTFNEGEAFFNGEELAELTVILNAVAIVETAVVISAFDIESRGRTVSYSMPNSIELPGWGIATLTDFSVTISDTPTEPYPPK